MIRITDNKLLILAVAVSSLFGCSENDNVMGVKSVPETAELAIMPDQVDDGWSVKHISQLGMNVELIKAMFNTIKQKGFIGIDGVVIAKSGYLVFEAYFNGYNRDKRHDLRSATKSITSALIGIAIDQQHIVAIDDSVYPYFQAYAPFDNWSAVKEQIKVKHLLTMTPGWDCDDWVSSSQGNEENMYRKHDWVKFILDLPMKTIPGNKFSYCTGGVVVLGELVKLASSLSVDEFSKRYLFTPLRITNYNWQYTPAGQVDAGGHIVMTPRDMAKFGQLFLQRGAWQGQQLISAAWVDESTAFHLMVTNSTDEYGYLWWRRSILVSGRSIGTYSARGNGGQFIFVIPSEEMVVVFTGSNYNSSLSDQPFEILQDYILKAIN